VLSNFVAGSGYGVTGREGGRVMTKMTWGIRDWGGTIHVVTLYSMKRAVSAGSSFCGKHFGMVNINFRKP
jgi:hypothetical protein